MPRHKSDDQAGDQNNRALYNIRQYNTIEARTHRVDRRQTDQNERHRHRRPREEHPHEQRSTAHQIRQHADRPDDAHECRQQSQGIRRLVFTETEDQPFRARHAAGPMMPFARLGHHERQNENRAAAELDVQTTRSQHVKEARDDHRARQVKPRRHAGNA